MVQRDLISSDAFAAIHLMAYCHAMNCTTNEQVASCLANHHRQVNVEQHGQLLLRHDARKDDTYRHTYLALLALGAVLFYQTNRVPLATSPRPWPPGPRLTTWAPRPFRPGPLEARPPG